MKKVILKLSGLSYRKKLLTLCLCFIFIFFVYFATTHAVVIVKSDATVKKVYVLRSGEGENLKEYSISNKKILILKSGNYSFTVYNELSNTVSYQKIGAFSYKEVSMGLKKQKKSSLVSKTLLDCSNGNNSKTIHYSCSGPTQTFEIANGVDKKYIPKPGIFEDEGESEDPASDQQENIAIVEYFDKPYKDGVLAFQKNQQEITAQLIDFDGNTGNKKTFNVRGMGSLNSSTVSTSASNDPKLAFLGETNVVLTNFEQPSESVSFDISKYIKNTDDLNKKVHLSRDDIFIVASVNLTDEIEEETEIKNLTQDFKEKTKKQKIIQIKLNTQEIKEHKVDKNFIISETTLSNEGNLLVVSIDKDDPVLIINNKVNTADISSGQTYKPCWRNSGELFYLSNDKKKIFTYDMNERTSYLVYELPTKSISSLFCNKGSFLFSITNAMFGFEIYALTDKEQGNSVRPEAATPRYYTFKADTYSLEVFGQEIHVSMSYDSDGNGPSKKEDLIVELNNYLSERGVNSKELEYIFSF